MGRNQIVPIIVEFGVDWVNTSLQKTRSILFILPTNRFPRMGVSEYACVVEWSSFLTKLVFNGGKGYVILPQGHAAALYMAPSLSPEWSLPTTQTLQPTCFRMTQALTRVIFTPRFHYCRWNNSWQTQCVMNRILYLWPCDWTCKIMMNIVHYISIATTCR